MQTNHTPSAYEAQLHAKTARISEQFAVFDPPKLEVFSSPITHFRARCEFRLWHDDGVLSYAMFETKNDKKQVVRLTQFPTASATINALMPVLLEKLQVEPILQHKAFAVEFLGTQAGDMLVTLIYHKKLDEAWQQKANALADALKIKLIGRSRGQKLVLSEDFVRETFTVSGRQFIYQQSDNGFSQPNSSVCEQMLGWASQVAEQISADGSRDLLELYCGNGNFTLPLSVHFNKVLATELAKSSVHSAQINIAQNSITNIKIARLSAEEFSQAYQGAREFRRLAQSGICLQDYDFSTIFVDLPRAGIDDDTLALMSEFEHIIYVSCNPDTLHANLQKLLTHHIKRFALFDQFPYTHHAECAVWLTKHK